MARTDIPVWLWPNVLSLDAPIVALVWQDFASRCFPSTLSLPARLALGLTVWAIYLGDRLIDIHHHGDRSETACHRFCRRNRGIAATLLLAVLLVDVLIAALWLRPVLAANGLWIGATVVLYLIGFPVLHRSMRRPKQIAAAIIFAAGVLLVAWTSTLSAWPTLAWPASAFCALCLGNLALIETWEHERKDLPGRSGLLLLALLCICLGRSDWYFAIGLSAVALGALDLWAVRLSRDAHRVLADAVLLTPILFR